jgi:cytochrome P450
VQYLVDIILNFIIAGRDTTANTLSWATYEMTRLPEEAAALRAEVDQVLAGKVPSFEDIFQVRDRPAELPKYGNDLPTSPRPLPPPAPPPLPPFSACRLCEPS